MSPAKSHTNPPPVEIGGCPISFTDPQVQVCPFPAMVKLHQEQPVYKDPVSGFYVVTKFDEVVNVCQKVDIFSSKANVIFERKNSPVAAEVHRLFEEQGFTHVDTLVSNDPPEFTFYRELAMNAFSMERVDELTPLMTEIANAIVDGFIERGAIEYRAEFAIPFALFVIADEMGVGRREWKKFKVWSDAAMAQMNPVLSPEGELEVTRTIIDMQQFLHQQAQSYRQQPANNLLSKLANLEQGGRRLTDQELISMSHIILVAGNEATANSIATSMFLMLSQPGVYEKLQKDRSLIQNFNEEVLRFQTPIPHIYRLAKQDTEISGVPIPKGSVVMVSWLGSNRDNDKFPEAEKFDAQRSNAKRHLAFGSGIHKCPGNLVARRQLLVCLDVMLERIKNIRLDETKPAPEFDPHFFARGLKHLHIKFERN